MISHKVIVNGNVFHLGVKNRVGREIRGADVVTIDGGFGRERDM